MIQPHKSLPQNPFENQNIAQYDFHFIKYCTDAYKEIKLITIYQLINVHVEASQNSTRILYFGNSIFNAIRAPPAAD